MAAGLRADGQPASIALGRDLGGHPQPRPYRSAGVEPMLGRVFGPADAGPDAAACVPASDEVRCGACRCPATPAPKEHRPWI
ncbi:hypothetical protein [Streptomyces sp. NPDC057623]|uniref:hypothetical protein n=1 Tax=Streptomyces sp. NPDC057623 TaxID=3346187 RepID=UPI00368B8555